MTLTWDDPQDDSITGYVVLRRLRYDDPSGHFDELAPDTGTAATTYTDDTVAAGTSYTYRIKAINGAGPGERSRWSHIDTPAAPEPPEPVNSPATGAPAISGTVQVGEELTAGTSGIADEDGLENAAFGYQWLAEGSDISGATARTHTLSNSDEGKAIRVKVSFTDDAGNDEELTSAATDAVAAAGPSEPPAKPTGLYATASYDQVTLTWDDPSDDSITGYVILRRIRVNDVGGEFSVLVPDTGAAATTYTDNTVAAETTYTYRIKAINGAGTSERSRWSHIDIPAAPEPASNNPATGTPAITGTAQVGETLTVDTSGIADEDGLENAAFSHQWLADGTAISGATANAYTPVEADEGKAVTVQVNFTDDAGKDETLTSAPTAAVAGAEPTEPSAQPTGLLATATHDSVTLTWNDPQDDSITGYVILRRNRDTDTEGHFDELVADTGTAAATYTDDTVAAETSYTYRIKAINGAGPSERSRWYHIDTQAAPGAEPGPADQAPANPTGLTAETVAHNTVTLTWDDPQDDSVTGYAVVRWKLGYNSSGIVTIAPDTGTADPGYTDGTVEPETEYLYNVKAINSQGESEKSEPLRVKTPEAPDPADLAPANLTAELVDRQVVLGWDAPALDAGAVTGYEVLRTRGEDESTTLAADTGSSATAYTDETADAPGESYAYRVKAVRDGERSQASNEALIQLPDPPPSAPSGLAASLGSGGVSLVWNAPVEDAGTVTGYEVLRAQGGGALTTLAADTGDAATAYSDFSAGGVSESYAYRVRAIRGEEKSADSNEARVQLPPARPTGMVSGVSSDLVLLSWADPKDDSVTGYRILRRHWAADEPGEFSTLAADTGTVETAYDDNTVETGRVYVYRVLAINPGGVSEPSQEVRVRTAAPVAPPEPARGLPATTQQVRQNVSEGGTDLPDDGTTTGRLEVGGSVTGDIDRIGDLDAFAVELVPGHSTYRFDLEGSETGQGTLADPKIVKILDTVNGVPIQSSANSDSGDGENSRLKFKLLPVHTSFITGDYYIVVGEDGDDATGTYRLSVMETAGSGYGKTFPVEGHLELGGTLSGTLPVHDGYFGEPHYFALDGLEVGRYTVSFSTGAIDSIHALLLRGSLPDDDTWLLTDQAFGRSSYTFDVRSDRVGIYSDVNQSLGTHYALLYIKEGAGGDYTATLEEAPPSLRVGGPAVEGEIIGDPNKTDGTYMLFYSVDLEDGETYQVDIKGKATGDGTMDRTMLGHVQAPDGSFVEDDNNLFVHGGGEGHNTRYVFTADQDGTHFLKVGGRIMTVSSGSRYRAGTFKVSIREAP